MLGKNTLLAFMLFASLIHHSAQAVNCPAGWIPDSVGTRCQPNKPSSDYFYSTSDNYSATAGKRAICGKTYNSYTRIPVLPSFEPLQISTSTYPNSSYNFPAVTGVSEAVPTTKSYNTVDGAAYLYENLTRCACFPAATAPTPAAGLLPIKDNERFTGGNFPGAFARIYPDTYDVISTQDQAGSVKYNLVAYSTDPTKDGRDGEIYNAGQSSCGCPNINETPEPNGTGVTGPVGVHCKPKIPASTGRVLTTYNPAFHDSGAKGVSGGIGIQYTETSPAKDIILPTATGGSQLYKRKIWTCAPPFVQSDSGCVPPSNWSSHQCNSAGIASPVNGSLVTGTDSAIKFDNTINKKLACCLNDYGDSGAFIKFDCIENAQRAYSSFNQLWSETDVDIDSSSANIATNAIVLAGPLGKYLTGFYTLDGVKCEEFSEFAGPITPSKLKKNATGGWTATASGGAVITPPSTMTGNFSGKTIPDTSPNRELKMRRCPILSRAAIIVTCPANPELPVVQKSYTSTGVTRCSAASSVQVHVRIEQVYEVEGIPLMKPVDTIMEKRLASSISVDKIIANKNGSGCPGGTTRQGDACVYQ